MRDWIITKECSTLKIESQFFSDTISTLGRTSQIYSILFKAVVPRPSVATAWVLTVSISWSADRQWCR